jgi:catechol 2,3-dioxygenase-like lactoylglutathione lyase family enzyme
MANFGEIRQVGYLTNNIEKAMQSWVEQSGVGPFTWYRNVSLKAVYKGEPSIIEMDVGIAYRGNQQIELIQQNNDAPSPYRQFFLEGRMGMHHLAFGSRDIDADLQKAKAAGFEIICTIDAMIGRYAYFQDPAMPENFFEFLAVNDELEKFWQQSMEEARHWDGSKPIRAIDLKGL